MNIPKEKLREGRMKALKKVKKEKSRKVGLVGFGSVIVLCFCFIFTVQQSPTFASFAAKIPGLSALVELIQDNEGIIDALENDYYEELGLIQSKDGKTVTLHGAIIDEYNVFLNYDFDFTRKVANHNAYDLEIFQAGKSIMEGNTSIGTMDDGDGPVSHSKHTFEMQLPKPIDRELLDFTVVITFRDGTILDFPFTLKNPIAKTKVTKANRVVSVSGQQFTITEIRRTPLRVAIDIEENPNNTMNILSYDGMAIHLNTGNERKPIVNGLSSYREDGDLPTTYLFQSNYFYEADELTITFDQIMAVPKDDNFIEVNFATNEVLYVPSYIDWDISIHDNEVTIKSRTSDGIARQYVRFAIKEDGSKLNGGYVRLYMDGHFKTTFSDYKGKAKLIIHYFDNPIGENIQVPISLQ
jgi:hypothetical protein